MCIILFDVKFLLFCNFIITIYCVLIILHNYWCLVILFIKKIKKKILYMQIALL